MNQESKIDRKLYNSYPRPMQINLHCSPMGSRHTYLIAIKRCILLKNSGLIKIDVEIKDIFLAWACESIPEVKRSETAWDALQKNTVDFRQFLYSLDFCSTFYQEKVEIKNINRWVGQKVKVFVWQPKKSKVKIINL